MSSNAGGVLVQKEGSALSDFELAYRLHKLENEINKLENKINRLENKIVIIEMLRPLPFTDISVSKAKSEEIQIEFEEIQIRRKIDKQLEYIIKNNRRNAALDYLNFSIRSIYEAEERILKLYKKDLKRYIEGMETIDINIMQASPNEFVPLAPAYIAIAKLSEKNLDIAFSIIKKVKEANEEIIGMADFRAG